MDPVVSALNILTKVLSLHKSPSGSAAILGGIDGKLDLAVRQLSEVQQALSHILVDISELRKEVISAIGQQYAIELFVEAHAALKQIQIVQRDAVSKRIPLTLENTNDRGLKNDLRSAYGELDRVRRLIRIYPQGRDVIFSPLLDAFILADVSAFSAGIIDEIRLSIVVEHHVDWLEKMTNPTLEYSAAWDLDNTINRLKSQRQEISKLSKMSDPAGVIANSLLSNSRIELCATHVMDVEYYTEWASKGWVTMKDNRYTITAVYSVDDQIVHGVALKRNIRYDAFTRKLKLQLGNGYVAYSVGGTTDLNHSNCLTFRNKTVSIPSDQMMKSQIYLERDTGENSKFNRAFGGIVSQQFITESYFARQITTNSDETLKKVAILFDEINHLNLRQKIAETALELIDSSKAYCVDLQKFLPKVP